MLTTELQAFGMIVTAEPYFAVTQPRATSSLWRISSEVIPKGKVEEIEAKYELLQRGRYTLNVDPSKIVPVRFDSEIVLCRCRGPQRNSGRALGGCRPTCQRYLSQSGRTAATSGILSSQRRKRRVPSNGSEAAQTAEDARLIARKGWRKSRQAQEREAAAERARQGAVQSGGGIRLRAEAERAKQDAEAARAAAIAQQDAARLEADRARRAAQETEQLRQQQQQQAEAEKRELRSRLTQQLNLILETRDSARGLIVSLSDVLFDTARYTLRPGAREKLSKIAGIVGVTSWFETRGGRPRSVGGEEYNQRLSENRAGAVRDYLIQQGVRSDTITARGFGESQPAVSNASAAGKQQNRRVELVVSGEPIGVSGGAVSSLR
jgi:outer membrane protein OmpA-like peptidoglycan-associated protein